MSRRHGYEANPRMSDTPTEWSFLATAWRYGLLLTGCQEGATVAFKDAVTELLRHPHAEERDRAARLFYSTLRRRAIRFPARNELPASLSAFHLMEERARSAVLLHALKALPDSDIQRLLEVDNKGFTKLLEQKNTESETETELRSFPLPEEAEIQIREAISSLGNKGQRSLMSNPSTIAVGIGFLLLIAVVVWNMMGRVGTFPDEAMKIATTGGKASPDQFQVVEAKAGDLEDWLMLKGFENFNVPAGLENFTAAGVRIFKVENEPVAQAAIVSDKPIYFYSFASRPLGVTVAPEGRWLISEADGWVLAIREDNGSCFMVAFRGNKQQMQELLESGGS